MIQFDDLNPPFDEDFRSILGPDGWVFPKNHLVLAGEWLNFLPFFVGLHMYRRKGPVQTLFAG